MSEMSDDTKIIFLSDADLTALKFLGPDAAQGVMNLITSLRSVPQYFGWLTVDQVGCLNTQLKYRPRPPPPSRTLPTSSNITLLSQASEFSVGDDNHISPFERAYFYNGVADDPPPLFQRSDLVQRPFPIPQKRPAERYSTTPVKTAHTANHPILKNNFWKESVAPEIIALCQEASRGIRVSTMLPVRFSTLDEDDKDVFDDHIVLWISVHPNTTKETSCRNANAPILDIFAKYKIHDVAVHWIEGAVESLAGPPEMMSSASDTNPTHWIRRALTTVLGIPLVAQDMAYTGSQGSLGLYFHRGKDKHGKKSQEVMAITNKHVVSKKTDADYEYPQGARKQYIQNCGHRRFGQLLNETRALLGEKLGYATLFAGQLTKLLADRPEEENASYNMDLKYKEQDLQRVGSDVCILSDFLRILKSTWSDPLDRIVAWVDWAPKIANNLDSRRYTRDIGVMTLEKDKFVKNFKGNVVYLAGKFTPDEIVVCFCPNATNPPDFGVRDAAGLSTPYCLDDNDNPCFTVAKDGQATDLTFGRQSELEAYTCRDLEGESWEVAVLNFGGRKHAIFNAEGRLVALLHSGMPRGSSNHVTFGTPGHYVMELVRQQYPDADFSRCKYDDDDATAA
ncbi:uncharacterized protein BXZ73DRAFT_74441 [Epithele typhae]|uniref:uncharacterized protein n=1 Tax=Epithele typhae TaxID=378194 RepID=UPI0020088E3D|nr:uncharacterized protein BXZ73DRAFT_74441 [Epithele typhae]KAH9943510.1 hypothetical protein BXZ73DRAFT_74441 [Epithele typhae]